MKFERIIEKVKRNIPNFEQCYELAMQDCYSAVVFGSYAYGCEDDSSDIDMLFIGNGKRVKKNKIDFIWKKPDEITSKRWLGSELANHIAEYGVWGKGDQNWRNDTFIGNFAIEKKKQKIYERMVHILLKRQKYSKLAINKLFVSVYLDFLRLTMLYTNKAIPPKAILIRNINSMNVNLIDEMIKDEYLGRVGENMIKEIFYDNSFKEIDLALKNYITSDRVYSISESFES
jgi:hypothetical protein